MKLSTVRSAINNKIGMKRDLEQYLGKVTNEMVKCGFLPILLTFITFHLHIILFLCFIQAIKS
jgi:hypothetical protein